MYYFYGFIAVILYSFLPPIAKKAAIDDIPPMMFIALTMFILASGALLGSFFFEKTNISNIGLGQWGGIISFGVINFIAFILFVTAIKYMPVAHYQAMGLLMPIIGGVIAYFWFDEKVSLQFIFGFVLMSIGLVIALWR